MRGQEKNLFPLQRWGKSNPAFENNVKALAPISALFHRQLKHSSFDASVTMKYKPKSDKDLAGITCYQSENFNYVLGITKKDKDFYAVLERTEKGSSTIIASEKLPSYTIQVQVIAKGDEYTFAYFS